MKQMAKETQNSKSDKVRKASGATDKLTKSQRMTQRALSGGVKIDSKTNSQANAILAKMK